jgi:ferredoxin--NADP+ reductase
MLISNLDTKERFSATLIASERLTPTSSSEEVRELTLELSDTAPELKLGQSIGVLAPGQKALGQEHHLRLYSVADLPAGPGPRRLRIAVRRCSYVDEYSGELYQGVASNYLCDLEQGDRITLTGPLNLPLEVPEEPDANLILIATSTGIAPFRAFVRHLYEHTQFRGKIWLFYGARTGLDMVYLNDERDDFAQYYDRETFQAFRALSPRPHFDDDIDWGDSIGKRSKELWRMLSLPNTYVYVAGLEKVKESLDRAFSQVADTPEQWERRKAELVAGRRWVELLY